MLTQLTKPEWDALTPKQRWDVTVALRGPDVRDSQTIKWFTTSVIRGKMMSIMRVGGAINESLNLIILPMRYLTPKPEVKEMLKSIPSWHLFDMGHFLGHVKEAAHALAIPIVSIDRWYELLDHHATKFAKGAIEDLTIEIKQIQETPQPKYMLYPPTTDHLTTAVNELKIHLKLLQPLQSDGYFDAPSTGDGQ